MNHPATDDRPTQRALLELLDHFPEPVFVLSMQREIHRANPAGRGLCDSGCAGERGGHLLRLAQMEAAKIEAFIGLAQGGTAVRAGLCFAPTFHTGWVQASRVEEPLAHSLGIPAPAVMLAVHLDQPELAHSARIDTLSHRRGLSQAERCVLMLLADGLSVQDSAEHLGVRTSTLRTHVRNLLSKTQAPSLMQLLRVVGSVRPLS
jgi:DNA-binding CsgD family transcriptional regulator